MESLVFLRFGIGFPGLVDVLFRIRFFFLFYIVRCDMECCIFFRSGDMFRDFYSLLFSLSFDYSACIDGR